RRKAWLGRPPLRRPRSEGRHAAMNAPASLGLALTDALVEVGRWLQESGYRFTTCTPATHARVNARPQAQVARTVRDVFGWSRPFQPGLLPARLVLHLERAGLLERHDEGLLRSRVR